MSDVGGRQVSARLLSTVVIDLPRAGDEAPVIALAVRALPPRQPAARGGWFAESRRRDAGPERT